MENKRASGILLHITSLPSAYGIGDLGPEAYRFADFLAASRQSLWQLLPLNPTGPIWGNSPYSSISAFAANTLLISPDILAGEGLLSKRDLQSKPEFAGHYCDYSRVSVYKEKLLHRAYEHFKVSGTHRREFESFCLEQSSWLDDFALFAVIRSRHKQKAWNTWEPKLRNRDQKSLKEIAASFELEIERVKFLQFLFFKQWLALKQYCNQKGIRLMGDIPIYVSFDSADVWKRPQIFKLDKNREPTHVAGVPPDYFSATGQLWGNPVYDWEALKRTGFAWWKERLRHNLVCFDMVRIDHFRGLVAFWEVKKGEPTAVRGHWRKVPWKEFFNALFAEFGDLPIIAEDLGLITDDVRRALRRLGFPGMKVLLFAFGEDNPLHPYLPHTLQENCVIYTGTHDNNTARGWFEAEARPEEKERLKRYLGRQVPPEQIHWELIRLGMLSVARMAIFPLQDVLGLDASARMNVPSTPQGNWQWRVLPQQLTPEVSAVLAEMAYVYGRT
jgi:4-alpha-glucanotransferase